MTSFYSEDELKGIGFKSIGTGNLISRKASIYGAENITIGNNNRIDDFSILSGRITLGSQIHLAPSVFLFGGKSGIIMEDFAGVSSHCVFYAESDDYTGEYMTNPTIPDEFKNVTSREVIISRHVLIGTGTSVLPGVVIGEGCSVGAMSLVNKSLDAWGIYAGIPCKRLKERSKRILELEKKFLASLDAK